MNIHLIFLDLNETISKRKGITVDIYKLGSCENQKKNQNETNYFKEYLKEAMNVMEIGNTEKANRTVEK